ncbi:ubiquitin carboxyl-terminal hydrolase 37-like [Engraulis encrasicolus]|uniref:ubiquitin carboxyl-terminal hydrolase 37-like n=1 Tax=Engraulis encrasicolus TaxID=184585 RepID=UPI002FD11074
MVEIVTPALPVKEDNTEPLRTSSHASKDCVSTAPLLRQESRGDQARRTDTELVACSQQQLQQLASCRGLPNLGNTCYMNSTLQCLLSLQPFCRQLLEQEQLWSSEAHLLLRSFVGLSSSPNALKKVTHLRELKAQVALCNGQFYGASQNDAQEFLMALLQNMQDVGRDLGTISPYRCPVASKVSFTVSYERTCQRSVGC